MKDLDQQRRELKALLDLEIIRMRHDRDWLLAHAFKYGLIVCVLLVGLAAWEYLVVAPILAR